MAGVLLARLSHHQLVYGRRGRGRGKIKTENAQIAEARRSKQSCWQKSSWFSELHFSAAIMLWLRDRKEKPRSGRDARNSSVSTVFASIAPLTRTSRSDDPELLQGPDNLQFHLRFGSRMAFCPT